MWGAEVRNTVIEERGWARKLTVLKTANRVLGYWKGGITNEQFVDNDLSGSLGTMTPMSSVHYPLSRSGYGRSKAR